MNPIFLITNANGKSTFQNKDGFVEYVQSLGNGIIEIVARKKRRSRTTGKQDELGNQNGYYWSIVLPLSAKTLGYTIKEMHEVFTQEFAPFTIKTFKEKIIPIKIRTSEMDTVQFTNYIESIRVTMAEMGTIIPDPEKIV